MLPSATLRMRTYLTRETSSRLAAASPTTPPPRRAKSDPKATPKRPKTRPRQPQEGLRDLLFSLLSLPSNLDCFGLRFGPLLGAFWTPRSAQNRSKNISKLCWGDRPSLDHPRRLQDHPKRPQDPPKDSQEAPRGPQDASKRPPGGSHETLRCPSKPLRCPLEASKFTPKGSKGHQEDPQ